MASHNAFIPAFGGTDHHAAEARSPDSDRSGEMAGGVHLADWPGGIGEEPRFETGSQA